MQEVNLFVALLAAVVLLALLAAPLRLPGAVALVLGGLALGALPFAPDVRLDPDLILLVFLPPILYPAAFDFAGEDLRSAARPIVWLAVGLVLATMAAVALAVHVVLGVPWAPAFVLGAILGATDPVAATSILRRAGAPGRIAAILEGESLVNDGTGLTAFRIAVGVAGTGALAPGSAALEFAGVALGGAAIGLALGWLTSELRRRLDAVEVEVAISVLLAYGSFILAEGVGVSGVLATVMAGLVVGHRSTEVASPETRVQSTSFWEVVQFLAESSLFLLVGVAFARVLSDPGGPSGWQLAGGTALVAAVTLGARAVWMAFVPPVAARMRHGETLPLRDRAVIGAGGMRGAVSVAAALAIPATAGGAPFPERDLVVALALGTVVVTLVLPALVFPVLLRALRVTGDEGEEHELEIRARLAHAALSAAEEIAAGETISEEALDRARERYRWRLARIERERGEQRSAGDGEVAREYREVTHRLVQAEREALEGLRSQREVSGDALRSIARELDLEEARLERR